MDTVLYLYPGNQLWVTSPAKITISALAPGEIPPSGATVIPTPAAAVSAPLQAADETHSQSPAPLVVMVGPKP